MNGTNRSIVNTSIFFVELTLMFRSYVVSFSFEGTVEKVPSPFGRRLG